MLSRRPVGEQRASKVKFPSQSHALAPHLLYRLMALGATDGSTASRPRAAFPGGFFLPSPGKNKARSSSQRSPETRPRAPALSRRLGRQAGGGREGSSPRSVLPTWTDLLGLEKGSRVSLGYRPHLQSEASRGSTHRQVSLALSSGPAPAPTSWPGSGSWVRAILLLLGTLPYLSFPTIY